MVRVTAVRSHPNRVRLRPLSCDVLLRHYIFAQHSASLANVELEGPSFLRHKLIFRQTIAVHFIPQRLWHARIVGQEVKESSVIVVVVLPYLCLARVAAGG